VLVTTYETKSAQSTKDNYSLFEVELGDVLFFNRTAVLYNRMTEKTVSECPNFEGNWEDVLDTFLKVFHFEKAK
jgi:hypothetical protein